MKSGHGDGQHMMSRFDSLSACPSSGLAYLLESTRIQVTSLFTVHCSLFSVLRINLSALKAIRSDPVFVQIIISDETRVSAAV